MFLVKFLWREAKYEQKERHEAALLRMGSEYVFVIQKGPSETAGKPGGEICEQKQDYLG